MSEFQDTATNLAVSIENLNGRLNETNTLLERTEKTLSKKCDNRDVLLMLGEHQNECENKRDSTTPIVKKKLSADVIYHAKLIGFMIGSALAALGIKNIF